MIQPSQTTPGARPWLRRLAEPVLIAVLALGAAVWGTRFWNEWTRQGNQPEFYQIYFEPAVMVACHRGFLISDHQPKALEDFLWRRRDALDCAELPSDLNLSTKNMYQGAWTYLQYMVGFSWRALGVSWSRMGPLFGVLFGTVLALAYGIFRIGMGPVLATACALGLGTSSMQLLNLPHLRDYAKAPFTLALVLIIGLLISKRWSGKAVIGWGAAYGVVLGFGYGFRTDLLIDLPLFLAVLFLFLDGGITKNLVVKVGATAAFIASFYVTSLPITSAVIERGGCQWHVALLGLQTPFEGPLQLTPAPYDFGYAYADGYIVRTIVGYTHRMSPEAPAPIYCSADYDRESGRYLMGIVSTFPGDFVTRAYASMLQMVELPYANLVRPAQQWVAPLFSIRQRLLFPRHSWGIMLATVALVMTSAVSIRLGLAMLFLLAYVGGYPAVQFQERHFFHLEFIGWWMLGFVVDRGWRTARAVLSGERALPQLARTAVVNGGIVIGCGLMVFGTLLVATRTYQQRQALSLIDSFMAAPKEEVAQWMQPLDSVAPGDWPQYLAVEVDPQACGTTRSLTFRYDPAAPNGDFTRVVSFTPSAAPGRTTILAAVFEKYVGLDAALPAGCVTRVARFTHLQSVPLLLGATLPPDWRERPLYQRLARFEGR